MKPENIPGEDWTVNAEILAEIEPTSRQLELFCRDQARQFQDNLAGVDFDCFAHKKE